MPAQRLAHPGLGRRQDPLERRMPGGEAAPGLQRRPVHREAAPVRESDRRRPPLGAVQRGADQQHRRAGGGESGGELPHEGDVDTGGDGDPSLGEDLRLGVVDLGRPVVHGQGDQHRSARRQGRQVRGPGQRGRHVLRPGRLDAPLHQRTGQHGRLRVGQQRGPGEQGPDLLPGGQHQRGVRRRRVHQRAHRGRHARRAVQVDQRGTPGGLGVPVGHPDHHPLLQAEDVAEVGRQAGDHGQLGRAGVAEHGGQVMRPEDVEGRLSYRDHG